jgi:hypothetical protein
LLYSPILASRVKVELMLVKAKRQRKYFLTHALQPTQTQQKYIEILDVQGDNSILNTANTVRSIRTVEELKPIVNIERAQEKSARHMMALSIKNIITDREF